MNPWLRNYDPWVPHTLDYPSRPLTDILDTVATLRPEAIATRFNGATLTYGALAQLAHACARGLEQLGIASGDRVGLMLPNCPQFIVSAFGILRLGAVVVNINPTFTPRELDIVIRDSGLRALITLDRLLPIVHATDSHRAIGDIVITAIEAFAPGGHKCDGEDGVRSLADVLAVGADVTTGASRATGATEASSPASARGPQGPQGPQGDDLAVLQYTGGTTGTPKAAMLTHASIFANVLQTTAFMYGEPVRFTDRYLLVIPMFHIYGFTVGMMRALWVGATITLIPKYDPVAMLTAIRDDRPGCVPAVPTIYVSLLNHPLMASSGLEHVRSFHTGGAPCPVDLIERFEAATGRQLNAGYGMSEGSPVLCTTPQQGLRKPGTVGLPLPDTHLKVVDLERGETTLPLGEAGELCVSGPQIMRGYWNRPDETARTLRTDAKGRCWLYTGDIARIDDDGFVTLVQRKKDVIIVDAFNVYPSEVEAVLHAHPAVRMAAAFGVPDAYHGEVVRASVVLAPAAHVTAADLLAHCRQQLAPYKVPAQIELRETLPTSTVGKVLYRVLRAEATTPGTD